MYFVIVAATMVVLPIAAILIEWLAWGAPLLHLIGKWFVFWAGGVRLVLAGLRQFFTPDFTAETIFETKDAGAKKIVAELGMGNLALGLIALLSLAYPTWIMPAAVACALFYGLAGLKHIANKGKNRLEMIATISDLWVALVFLLYIAGTVIAAV